MDSGLHTYFDNYYFTIYRKPNEKKKRKTDVFTVKIGENKYPRDAQFANLDGKILSFGEDMSLWPHGDFLKFHNEKFAWAQMKGAAEPKPIDRQDTEGTMVHNFDAIDHHKAEWIKNQRVENYEQLEDAVEINYVL